MLCVISILRLSCYPFPRYNLNICFHFHVACGRPVPAIFGNDLTLVSATSDLYTLYSLLLYCVAHGCFSIINASRRGVSIYNLFIYIELYYFISHTSLSILFPV